MVCKLFLIVSIVIAAVQGNHKLSRYPTLQLGETCIPGQKYRQDCNTCECTPNYTLICTKMHCLNQKEIQKLLHLNLLPQRSGVNWESSKFNCVPGKIYKWSHKKCFCDNTMTPICMTLKESTRSGKSTTDLIPKLTDEEFEKLPALPFSNSECKAGSIYRVLCNTCLCLASGNTLCENKMCYSPDDVNRVAAFEKNGKPCTPKDKLNIECVDCKCVNEVWKCESIDGCFSLNLRSKLHGPTPTRRPKTEESNALNKESKKKCKKKKTAIDEYLDDSPNPDNTIWSRLNLDYENEKCTPDMAYKLDCNNCYCQPDSSLRCTLKKCLNYVQSEILDGKSGRRRTDSEELSR